MKKLLIILIALLSLQGCISEKRCMLRYPPQIIITDSVVLTNSLIERDTVIKLAADSSSIQMLIDCDSLNQAYLSRIIGYEAGNNAMIPEVVIQDRILTVKCRVDSMAVYSKIKERFEKTNYVSQTIQKHQVTPVTKSGLSQYRRTMFTLGWVFSGLVVLAIIMALIRFKNNIKNLFKL